MKIYSYKNLFNKPYGVIVGEAKGTWKEFSTEIGIAEKVIERMLDGINSEYKSKGKH